MLAFFPDQTAPFTLPMYAAAPEPRPTFHARFLTAREMLAIDELRRQCLEAAGRDDGQAAALDALDQIVARHIARAENMPPGFDIAKATSHFDGQTCWELVEESGRAIAVAKDDLKKSASPSKSDAASSASTAEPAPAAA